MTLDLTDRLTELAARHKVPGASVAVLSEGQVTTAACGVLHVDTGVEATPDSLFQIGSITKVYTATVIMALVAKGAFALDDRVVDLVPGFALADAAATQTVTVRHLLTHTGGFDGDHFLDTGRGDDCVERYVASLAEVGQNHPVGATMSYCNSGYTLLGRIIEVVTGTVWDQAITARLFDPAGFTHTVTLPEDALRFRTATGHFLTPDGNRPSPQWGLMRSCGPAGLICATASDVIGFARLHLDGGGAVLDAASVTAMQQPQVQVPDRWTLGDSWGLGWILFTWDGRPVYGHDGSTLGQNGYLRVVPDTGVAVALLVNGGAPADVAQDLLRAVLAEEADMAVPPRPQPPDPPVTVDPTPYLGLYEREAVRIAVTLEDGRLILTDTNSGPLAAMVPNPVKRLELTAVDPAEHLFVTRVPGTETWVPVVFFTLADGTPYVHYGARATPRTDDR